MKKEAEQPFFLHICLLLEPFYDSDRGKDH